MDKTTNPWSTEDEKEHYPSAIEWWCAEGFLNALEENKKFSFKGSFTEWSTKEIGDGSTYDYTLFDLKEKKHHSYYVRNAKNKLETSYDQKNKQTIKFKESFLKGLYPNYKMILKNPEKNIVLDLFFKSESLPHWITQNITEGYLPMGVGFYRYGFIPKNDIKGKLKIENKIYNLKGTGYYEHVWGEFSYRNPLLNLSSIKKSLEVYSKLIGWWIHNHKPKIPNKINFLSENNPLGYDWIWGVFDNGWSVYLGNILFWMAEGPIFGTLIFTKDGKRYEEFCNVTFKYKKTKKSKNYDFFYPSEIEIKAVKNKERLFLNFKMTSPCREFVNPLNKRKWVAFVICEAPGIMKGLYEKDSQKTFLKGKCKIEPQRQISIYGHNALSINFIKPPKGVGIDIDLNSHYLKKRIKTNLRFAPKPRFNFEFKK